MQFDLVFQPEAEETLNKLEQIDPKKSKKVLSTLGKMQTNMRYPGLRTHKYNSLSGPEGEEVFEAYVENQTSAAYRVFWYYGIGKNVITILAITPHP